ncbi:MAG: hypothetical protein JRD89_20660, partial [Deltaproteobacteria bacterium]|nr:hypothetical protein [Deltaproteobacteria bacterium]
MNRLTSPVHDSPLNYHEVLLEIDGWQLLRRSDEATEMLFACMMAHNCPELTNGQTLKNGEGQQWCQYCKDPIPDEIWALWILTTADQRIH